MKVISQRFQSISLSILYPEPPDVKLSEEKLIFEDSTPQKLSCHCHRYYPLDVQVSSLSQQPKSTKPYYDCFGVGLLFSIVS